MVLWILFEAAVSTVATYNFVKGAYTMYRDVEHIKEQYRDHQKNIEDYLRAQGPHDSMTESQFTRFEGEFVVL